MRDRLPITGSAVLTSGECTRRRLLDALLGEALVPGTAAA